MHMEWLILFRVQKLYIVTKTPLFNQSDGGYTVHYTGQNYEWVNATKNTEKKGNIRLFNRKFFLYAYINKSPIYICYTRL